MPTKQSPTNFIKHLFFLVKVEGESAWPELIPEKHYFATSLLRPKPGDFVVFENPDNWGQRLIKKVSEIKNNAFCVKGVVSWSDPSWMMRPVPRENILGKIIFTAR